MTVKELMALLEDQDPDTPVHFTYNYGDHRRTQVAPEVRRVEEGNVQHDSYTDLPAVTEDYPGEEHEDGVSGKKYPIVHAVLLSA